LSEGYGLAGEGDIFLHWEKDKNWDFKGTESRDFQPSMFLAHNILWRRVSNFTKRNKMRYKVDFRTTKINCKLAKLSKNKRNCGSCAYTKLS
jgi:hypothetical protein